MIDPYKVLGVSRQDSIETIKRAYRKAAKECHPDTHQGDKKAEERFKELGEAYRILTDKKKRDEYDERVRKQSKSTGNQSKEDKPNKAIFPDEIHSQFERFFSVGNQGTAKDKKSGTNGNPIDVSHLFERYMGFKR